MSFINKIVNTGVKEEFPFPAKRKIILLNYLCIIASFVLVVYLPVNYFLELPAFFYLINIVGQAIVFTCIWLNHKGKYNAARVFASIFWLLFINSFCLITGEGTGTEYINIVLFVLPMVIFDSKRMIIIFSVAAVLCFILCKFVFAYYSWQYSHHASDALFYWIGIGVVFFSIFYLLSRFKQETLSYTKLIEDQHEQLTEKNEEINASLRYAKRIQRALFFDQTEINRIIPNSFGYLSPHGVVSGDFFWISKIENKIFAAVADCTGHGVPAALMTVVGHNLLNEGLTLHHMRTPGSLLAHVNKSLLLRFKEKSSKDLSLNDGMDIGICMFDFAEKKMEYAGANRPLYLIRDNNLLETVPTKCSLGGHTLPDQVFENNLISLEARDYVYLFTDGCTDQHGGDKGKKFSKKRLRELLLSFDKDLTIEERQLKVKKVFVDWQGTYPKTDDSLIIGVKV